MNILNEAIRYIGQITGYTPTFIPLTETEKADVSVYLVELYELFYLKIFNRELVLAVAKDHEGGFTPAEYAAHAEQLRDALEESIALVLYHVTAYQRHRLIKKGVAFIVPERQMFLPHILVDLRDYFPRSKRLSSKTLSYPAQLVILYHLLKAPIELYSLRELAKRLGYSAMTLSNVADELSGLDLCKARTTGRKRNLKFKLQGRKLWEEVLPRLRTPVQTHRWVRDIPPKISVVKAGITALSLYTQIGDDFLPTYAIRNREYRKLLETGDLIGCHGPDEAKARIEAWGYAPELLADDDRVDRLSLYVALRNSPDERVTKALREMLRGIQW